MAPHGGAEILARDAEETPPPWQRRSLPQRPFLVLAIDLRVRRSSYLRASFFSSIPDDMVARCSPQQILAVFASRNLPSASTRRTMSRRKKSSWPSSAKTASTRSWRAP